MMCDDARFVAAFRGVYARGPSGRAREKAKVAHAWASLSPEDQARIPQMEFHKIFAVPVDVAPRAFAQRLRRDANEMAQLRHRTQQPYLGLATNDLDQHCQLGVNPNVEDSYRDFLGGSPEKQDFARLLDRY